jgi:phosphoribosylamine---glycine ligase
MKILVVGGGGREHTITWKLSQSEMVTKLFAAPGNAGITKVAECLAIAADDIQGIVSFSRAESIDLVVVGPEVPLCMGLSDALIEAGIPVFGPSAAAARIEGSKAFSKDLMRKYDVPTAEYERFDVFEDATSYSRQRGTDCWIKASGLAAGKGAVYASDPDEAERILREMMVDRIFGDSGGTVVIEENMTGEEASIFAVCDGEQYRLLVSSQDHKRAYDNDEGPNTGGMGAYAPAPLVTDELMAHVEREIIVPTLDGMAREGAPYRGVLYTGIMNTPDGPKVVEYNCRFGDPETQAVLPLYDGDLAELLFAAATGRLSDIEPATSPGYALCVVIASGGYPGEYKKGLEIHGLDEAGEMEGVQVFHAGTRIENGCVVTTGGRVLGVTGTGSDFHLARDRAYAAVDRINFTGAFHRTDIGGKALRHLS